MSDISNYTSPHSALTRLLKKDSIPHYYGDIIRRLFILAGIIMFTLMPVFSDRIPEPTSISILAVIILVAGAGITNPKRAWTAYFDLAVSSIAIIVFEYYGILTYSSSRSYTDSFFIVNQILAVLFLLAFYYSVKTVRGTMIKN